MRVFLQPVSSSPAVVTKLTSVVHVLQQKQKVGGANLKREAGYETHTQQSCTSWHSWVTVRRGLNSRILFLRFGMPWKTCFYPPDLSHPGPGRAGGAGLQHWKAASDVRVVCLICSDHHVSGEIPLQIHLQMLSTCETTDLQSKFNTSESLDEATRVRHQTGQRIKRQLLKFAAMFDLIKTRQQQKKFKYYLKSWLKYCIDVVSVLR